MKKKILSELAQMDFEVVAHAMKSCNRKTLNELVRQLEWAYELNEVTNGKMRNELEYAYKSDTSRD